MSARRMRAYEFQGAGKPLEAVLREVPVPEPHQVLLKVATCGVCRTDLHLVDGELPNPRRRVIPGHEIVGRIEAMGASVHGFRVGQRLGVPWLGHACGECRECRRGLENLCPNARFTGFTLDGGYAEHVVADARHCLALPERYSDLEAAPLLCAGLIGYRAYRMAGDAPRLGLYGFGAAAHLLCQVAVQQGREVYAFTRAGDVEAQGLARGLGAKWAGDSTQRAPTPLDAAIIFAPVGELVTRALGQLAPGGTVVCAGIHMSDVPGFAYAQLWGERSIRSVANLTRADGEAYMKLAAALPLRCYARGYPFAEANRALEDLRAGRVAAAAVLVMDG